jgi:4-amino-4-deoxy-L-arabinose transferase-like glycosyltransferase
VLLGVGTVGFAYLTAREAFPRRREMWTTVPVLVSFQPMFTFTNAVVNTDALLILAFGALIWLSIRALKVGITWRTAAGIGAAFGAGLLTKPFILAAIPPLALLAGRELVRAHRHGGGRLRVWRALATMTVVVVLMWSPWVVYSTRLGNSPFYANPIRTGQLQLEHPFYDYALGRFGVDYGISLLGGTWASFWGYFGWLDTPLDRAVYVALYVVCGIALAGLGLYVARWIRRRGHPLRSQRVCNPPTEAMLLGYLGLCALSMAGTLGATNYYSWRARGVGGGIQGRYYLGAIVPVVTLLSVGLTEWLPERWKPVGHWALCWAIIVLNGIALIGALLPRYYL